MSESGGPFERDVLLDQPGIVGARWWHKALADQERAVNRRGALKALAAVTVGVAAVGGIIALVAGDSYDYQDRNALEMQREYGWNFGATGEPLVFNGDTMAPFDPAALDRLAQDLAPTRFGALHVPTLLQAPTAWPRRRADEESEPFVPLKNVLRPIYTPAMGQAFAAGAALASLFRGRDPRAAVAVDLPGPEAVAFAAGAAEGFEPVLLVDNWPHPRGVVPAHLTLAALVYYQPLFARRAAERTAAPVPPLLVAPLPPLLVLDRARLAPYADESTRFDNRHTARIPAAPALRALGIERLLYVVPTASALPELDDLNDDFAELVAAGVAVRAVAVDAFAAAADGAGLYYGGSAQTHEGFWLDYAWGEPQPGAVAPAWLDPRPKAYAPARRATSFTQAHRPPRFGLVSVVLAAGGAAVLGARFDRRGSWNRTTSSSGG